jgi:phosphatidylserine/phosphatidylglycerophosphate/cardiolipin synthase-like enzyme
MEARDGAVRRAVCALLAGLGALLFASCGSGTSRSGGTGWADAGPDGSAGPDAGAGADGWAVDAAERPDAGGGPVDAKDHPDVADVPATLDVPQPADVPVPRDLPPRDLPPRDVVARDVPPPPDGTPPPDTWVPPDVAPPPDTWVRPDVPAPPDVPSPRDVPPPPRTLLVEIQALDLWAQALPAPAAGTSVTLTRDAGGAAVPLDPTDFPVVYAELPAAGDYTLTVAATDHRSIRVRLSWDGGTGTGAFRATPLDAGDPSDRSGLAVSHRSVTGGTRHTVHVGLRHRWFAPSGPPARRGNRVTLLMDGAEAWQAVHTALQGAQDEVLTSTWWWDSSFELLRPLPAHLSLSAADRWNNTIFMTLWRTPALIRTLVAHFWGQDSILSWITSDAELEAVAEDPDDGWEFMGQGNPTTGRFWFEIESFRFGDRVRGAWPGVAGRDFDGEPWIPSPVPGRQVDLTDFPFGFETEIASYHQKFSVIDGRVAFIGGMNFRTVDWDTPQHLVFDPRRMAFGATTAERRAVQAKEEEPDNGPRKDYVARLEGPGAADAAAVFRARWNLVLAEGVEFSENASWMPAVPVAAPLSGGVQAQVAATLPTPFRRAEILESWLNAIRNAEQYIFIEDQYWRLPVLQDALVQRMTAVPSLRLLVVTKPVSEWTDPGCRWTAEVHDELKTRFPTRYRTYRLRSFDYAVVCDWCWQETEAFFRDIDVHSKMLIVDDRFVSVGSCNKNNRGVVYEAELNLEVLDAGFATTARRRITDNMLGYSLGGFSTFDAVWSAFAEAAAWNDGVYADWDDESFDLDLDGDMPGPQWLPEGFLYSLDFRTPDYCLIEDLGPDIAK